MTEQTPPFRWRSIALPALLPTALFSIGEGAIVPVIPALATDLGATLAVAGFIAAMLTLGELLGDVPSGWIVSRIGERNAKLYATVVAIAEAIGFAERTSVAVTPRVSRAFPRRRCWRTGYCGRWCCLSSSYSSCAAAARCSRRRAGGPCCCWPAAPR